MDYIKVSSLIVSCKASERWTDHNQNIDMCKLLNHSSKYTSAKALFIPFYKVIKFYKCPAKDIQRAAVCQVDATA